MTMDREELVNTAAKEIFRLRSADRNVTSRALARAALAVIEPAIREDERRPRGGDKTYTTGATP